MPKKFAKTIYVKLDQHNNEEPYYVAADGMYELCEMGDKIKIATYQLVETTDAEVVLSTKRSK